MKKRNRTRADRNGVQSENSSYDFRKIADKKIEKGDERIFLGITMLIRRQFHESNRNQQCRISRCII